ncbi:MAG: ABC transporter permease subunit [Acidimicrobiia bacterium]|nr:ABC transporter permease subunit [Acidimicrobiia bacterium]
MNEREGRRPSRLLPSRDSGRGFWIRILAVGFFDALVIATLPMLYANEAWVLLGAFLVAGLAVNWAYLSPRARASKWLTPGLLFMALFVVYPVGYTFYVSVTNWATGNVLEKEVAIERLESREIRSDEAAQILPLAVYRNPAGDIAFLVLGEEPFFGAPRPITAEAVDDPSLDTAGAALDGEAPPDAIGEYELLGPLQLTGIASQLQNLALDIPGLGEARLETFSTVRVSASGQRFFYDPATETLYDAQEDRTCDLGVGTFVCNDVPRDEVSTLEINRTNSTIACSGGTCDNVPLQAIDQSLPGWRTVIGFDNYTRLFTNERIRQPFVGVFVWNLVFAVGTVLINFVLGLALASALQDERLRGRALYRSILILPYAVPAFLSTLIWRGMLNEQFGQVNDALATFGIDPIPWLADPTWAKVAVLLVNLWLGFPYMFLITSGALTSIPAELKEAARVDGASPWMVFRTVTLPLLLVSTAPLLIGAFAFNFNNFVLILLLTQGGPPLTGFDVPVGATDILISFTFDLASGAGRGNQFALASAIVVLIFIVVAVISAVSFRFTKRLEDVYGN